MNHPRPFACRAVWGLGLLLSCSSDGDTSGSAGDVSMSGGDDMVQSGSGGDGGGTGGADAIDGSGVDGPGGSSSSGGSDSSSGGNGMATDATEGGGAAPNSGGGGAPGVDTGEDTNGSNGEGGSGGNATTDAADGGAGNTSGSGAAGGSGGGPTTLTGDCSDEELRTGPPVGKEMFRADPIDEQFPFSTHYMGTFSDDPRYVSMTSLSDIDNDGDLDFASGQRHDLDGGMSWWEYCSPDHWVQHYVGIGHTSAAGGNAADVDADGWVDLLAGDSWYKNPGNPRESEWERFAIGAPGAEELIVGDVTGDGQEDVLWVWRSIDAQVWTPAANPETLWEQVAAFTHRQQQGGAIGDIDGDGDNDILVGNEWWYRNLEGDGSMWEDVNIEVGADFDDAPLTYLGDFDGDADIDLVMATHFGNRVAWVENLEGDGTAWELHDIADDKQHLHAVVAADFDNDGDIDIFAGQNVGPSWIFANDGEGNFTEHAIAADGRAHEARVGDVDCDGDLDIAGKPWGDPGEGGEADLEDSRDHVYFRNMLVEQGGPASFAAPPGEVRNDIQERDCR